MTLAMAVSCCSSPAGPPPAGDRTSFARDIAPVLAERCATARGCHGADPTPAVDLDLRGGTALQALVGVRAETGAVPLLRVAPGDPDRSLLVRKLTGGLDSTQGKRMPLDPRTHGPAEPLPPEWIDGVLIRWIEAGASAGR
jgi:hypothetical protein